MGCLVGLGVLAAILITGGILAYFKLYILAIIVSVVIFLAGAYFVLANGHWGFGGRGNTDFSLYIAVIGITAAITIPAYRGYLVKQHCTKALNTLDNLVTAEQTYHNEHGSFTTDLQALKKSMDKEVSISITNTADSGISITASHPKCDLDGNKGPDLFIWNSPESKSVEETKQKKQ